MNFVVTERIALGKSGKRVTAQPIGRATERDFDWKSVQLPERWRDETDGKDRRSTATDFRLPPVRARPRASGPPIR
jgi:hypothetical protein